jgi:hypothetical protein
MMNFGEKVQKIFDSSQFKLHKFETVTELVSSGAYYDVKQVSYCKPESKERREARTHTEF